MTDYTYTVDSTNYEENVTFNLNKGDNLKVISSTSSMEGYGICGDVNPYPDLSIADWDTLTGISIDKSYKVMKNRFFNITITGSELNKNFDIQLWGGSILFSKGGIVKIAIKTTTNINIKVNNSYVDGSPKIKINGNWTDGSAYVKIDGSWRN